MTNFQNLKSKLGTTDDFTKQLLLKTAREDLVEKLLTQSRELSYGKLVKDLRRLGYASRIYSLLGSESKETPEKRLRGSSNYTCSLCEEPGYVDHDCNTIL